MTIEILPKDFISMENEEDGLQMLLKIINATINPSPDEEQQKQVQMLLLEFISNPQSLPIFLQILSSNSYSDAIEFYAFAGFKSWFNVHWDELSSIDQTTLLTENLLPFIFTPKSYGKQLRDLFYRCLKSLGNSEAFSYTELCQTIVAKCPEILSQPNLPVEQVLPVIENLIYISHIIKLIYHEENQKEIFNTFLVQIFELSKEFLKPEYLESKEGCKILSLAIQSYSILPLLSLANEFNPLVETFLGEICQFFLFFFSSIESLPLTDELMDLLLICANIYQDMFHSISAIEMDVMDPYGDGKQEMPPVIQTFRNEWQPQISLAIFAVAWYLFSNNCTTRYKIGQLLSPLTEEIPPFPNLDEVITILLEYIAIDPNDESDFQGNPELFYQMNYSIVRNEYGNLRNNALLIADLIFVSINDPQICVHLFTDVITLTEPGAMLVARNIKYFIDLGLGKCVYTYAYSFLQLHSSSQMNIFLVCSTLFFFSKYLSYESNPEKIGQLLRFALTSLTNFHLPVLSALSIRLIYAFYRAIRKHLKEPNYQPFLQLYANPSLFAMLLQEIDKRISNDVLKLIRILAEDFPDSVQLLAANGTELIELIIREMNSEPSEFDQYLCDYKRIGIENLLEIIVDLINSFSDQNLEQPIFALVDDCIKFQDNYSFYDNIYELIASLINCNSQCSGQYINFILEKKVSPDISQWMPIFLLCFSKSPPEFSLQIIPELYKVLIELITEEKRLDKFDHFALCIMLSWIFQIMPDIITSSADVGDTDSTLNASFFIEYLTNFSNSHEIRNSSAFAYQRSAFLNLVLTLSLLQKIDMTPEYFELWFTFLREKQPFVRQCDIEFHATALNVFVQRGILVESGAAEALQIIQEMKTNPEQFLFQDIGKSFSAFLLEKKYEIDKLSYPIVASLS